MKFISIFAKEKINLGRQVEIDIAKALSIIFMIFCHVQIISAYYSNTINPIYKLIVVDIFGGAFAAPIFMFCMGVALVYSKRTQWDLLIKRGLKLLIMALFVNICEAIIPHFLSGILLGNSDAFPIYGGLIIFYCDILFFASFSLILIDI